MSTSPTNVEVATAPNAAVESAVLGKVTRRLIPLLFLLYMANILDRTNVGFASLHMQKALAMSEQVFALGGSLFFVGYFVFEVPSNLMLRRVGARRWLGRIIISWGLVSAGMMFVQRPVGFYLARLLLGVAEAGFFPGIIFYLSYWFPARTRARAVSRFMTASALTGLVGGPLSGTILQFWDGIGGLAAWQWVFVLEGLPTVVLGILVLSYLTDRPEQARWLTPDERGWLAAQLRGEESEREARHSLTLLRAFADRRVWLLCLVYFTVSMGANSFGLYLPKFLAEHFTGASDVQLGFLAAVPSLAAVLAMIAVGVHSDRTGERRWHVAGSAFAGAAGWAVLASATAPWQALLGLTLAQAGMMSMLAPFWSLPTALLSGTAAAGGIAFINSVGNLGGFAGPNVLGQLHRATESFTPGQWIIAGILFAGGLLVLRARQD